MEILIYFIHAYLYIILYEFMTGKQKQYVRIIFVIILASMKYVMEYFVFLKPFIPIMIIALLMLHGIFVGTKKSFKSCLKPAIIVYGISLSVSTLITCTAGMLLGLLNVNDKTQMYGIIGGTRLILIIIFIKIIYLVEKIRADWALNIAMVASLVMIFMEQVLRFSYIIKQKSFVYVVMTGIIIAILFTALWLVDHHKMYKIQVFYEEDNRQMSRKLHRIKEVLPLIANYLTNAGGEMDEKLSGSLKQMCIDYNKELGEIQMSAEFFNSTGVPLVDLLLQSKMIEFNDKGIELDVFVSTNIEEELKKGDISDGECMRMLADLLRNAEYAVEGEFMKLILMMIVRDQRGILWMKLYDSGVPFPEKVLAQLGKRGATTWGTGNGISDVLETLRRARASFEIHTKMEEDDLYTKEVALCFDGRSRIVVC